LILVFAKGIAPTAIAAISESKDATVTRLVYTFELSNVIAPLPADLVTGHRLGEAVTTELLFDHDSGPVWCLGRSCIYSFP
jgi:hypothetical protein